MNILEIGCKTLLEQGQTVFLPEGPEGTLLLLTYAPLRMDLNGVQMHAEAGDAVIVSAKTPLRYTPAEQDLLCDWALFDAGADLSFYTALQIPENTLLRFGDTVFLSTLLEQLCAEFYAANPRRSDMIDCLSKALLIRIAETGGPVSIKNAQGSTEPHYAELQRLREKIYANPQEKWSVELLCSEVNMSRSYFQLIYRETFGMTCIADVINCKMNRARELLVSTGYTISHIAQLCGYDSEEHFMRQFKKNNGVTPTVYRREHRT